MQIEGTDELDRRILDIIKDQARLTYKEIGEQVGISRVSVKARMDAMQEKGIIKGYQTVIDPVSVPGGIHFFLDLETDPDCYEDTLQELAAGKIIRRIYAVSGQCRLHAEGFAPNSSSLSYFANTIYRGKKGVRKLELHTVLSALMDLDGGVEYVRYQESEHLEGKD